MWWVRTDDRLPNEGQRVLCYMNGGDMLVGYIRDRDEDLIFWKAIADDGYETEMDYDPVCWMPLPEKPPRELLVKGVPIYCPQCGAQITDDLGGGAV